MGESACFYPDFSLQSQTSTSEMASALSALGESVSFGRFLSESLDWGRFSSFNQKKYLEEAKQYSRPGSVAEKKALFEARYKKSSLLRRSISVMENPHPIVNNRDLEIQNSKEGLGHRGSESEVAVDSFHTAEGKLECFDLGEEVRQIELEKGREINQDNFNLDSPCVGKCGNFDFENKMDDSPEKEPLQESWVTNQSNKGIKTEKVSRTLNLKAAKIPKPFKPSPSLVSTKVSSKENVSNSSKISNNQGRNSVERIRLASRSVLHMSINHPIRADVTPSKADVRTKIARFEAANKSLKASQRHNVISKSSRMMVPKIAPQTPEIVKVPRIAPQTPQSEQRKLAFGTSYSRRSLARTESSHISTGNSKVSSSKLEKDKPSVSLYRKSDKQDVKEEKAEIELKEFRQGLCFKARPLPDFYRKIEEAKEPNNKVTLLRAQSPVFARTISAIEKPNYNNAPLPPSKPVLRRISSSKSSSIEPKLGATSQSVVSFSKDQNKWTITLSRK